MYIAKIVYMGVNSWDDKNGVFLSFKNRAKCEYFASYYSSKNDVLVKVLQNAWWYASFVGGKEIWNDFNRRNSNVYYC